LEVFRSLLADILSDLEYLVAAEDDSSVFWAEREGKAWRGASLMAAPLSVAEALNLCLYSQKLSVVFCSATLQVRGSFDFMRKRLGLELMDGGRVATFDAGSAFDYTRQCGLIIPAYFPEPGAGMEPYCTRLAELLDALFSRLRGRGMVLFTSYAMMRRTAEILSDLADHLHYEILVQGLSGSRTRMTKDFRENPETVLLGTHSFWEGVDIVGDSLSCLVIARLPFQVHTDPLVEARCDHCRDNGEDPFRSYMLPNAVIRLRQGFGRLIRNRQDRGLVVLADKRCLTKSYGKWFRESLPVPAVGVNATEEALQAADAILSAS